MQRYEDGRIWTGWVHYVDSTQLRVVVKPEREYPARGDRLLVEVMGNMEDLLVETEVVALVDVPPELLRMVHFGAGRAVHHVPDYYLQLICRQRAATLPGLPTQRKRVHEQRATFGCRSGLEELLFLEINRKGFSALTTAECRVGELLEMYVGEEEDPITFRANVRHCRPYEEGDYYLVGAMLADITPIHQSRWDDFCEHAQAPPEPGSDEAFAA